MPISIPTNAIALAYSQPQIRRDQARPDQHRPGLATFFFLICSFRFFGGFDHKITIWNLYSFFFFFCFLCCPSKVRGIMIMARDLVCSNRNGAELKNRLANYQIRELQIWSILSIFLVPKKHKTYSIESYDEYSFLFERNARHIHENSFSFVQIWLSFWFFKLFSKNKVLVQSFLDALVLKIQK